MLIQFLVTNFEDNIFYAIRYILIMDEISFLLYFYAKHV